MLRSIKFKNLINFKERQVLEFQDGVNFLIGANSTGKSSICELIRRCHSVNLSSSISNLLNENEPGYIVSKYEGCSNLLKGIFGESQEVKTEEAFLCYVHEMEKETNKIYKCVCFESTTDGYIIYIAVSQYENNLKRVVRRFPLHNFKDRSMKDFITAASGDDDQGREQKSPGEHRFLENIKQILQKPEGLKSRPQFTCTSEDILEKLQTTFACVFPVRSFGPIQWINGNIRRKLDASKNYRHAHTQAEILWDLLPEKSQGEQRINNWQGWMYYLWSIFIYFSSGLTRKSSSHEFEHINERERSLFNRITYPLEYEFRKIVEEGKIEVIHKNDPSPKPRSFELLKAPEGIVEAKQATLVLSHRKLKTICYEDIERGMHNQMIENMNNFVLKKIKKKTVIVVTHSPAIMNRWALGRTYACSRQKDGKDERFINIVKKVPEDYASKYGVNHEMKKILFSAHVLLVEGNTEINLLRSLFDYIFSKKKKLKLLGKRLKRKDQTKKESVENALRTLCLLQVVSAGSKTQLEYAENFCQKVNIFATILIDNDEKNQDYKKLPPHQFMWKYGTIEDALKKDCLETVKTIVTQKNEPYDDSKWEIYKKRLKKEINKGISDVKYDELFRELFEKFRGRKKESEFLRFFKFIEEQNRI